MPIPTITFPDGTAATAPDELTTTNAAWALVAPPATLDEIRASEEKSIADARARIDDLRLNHAERNLDFVDIDAPVDIAGGTLRRVDIRGTETFIIVNEMDKVVDLNDRVDRDDDEQPLWVASETTLDDGLLQTVHSAIEKLEDEIAESNRRIESLKEGKDARTEWRLVRWTDSEEDATKLQNRLARLGRELTVHRVDGHLDLRP